MFKSLFLLTRTLEVLGIHGQQLCKSSRNNGMEGKLAGKVAVVTGASSGIGVETARALAATGATLYLTARDLAKARIALGDILQPDKMELVEMDQTSLESMRSAAKLATNHLSHFLFFHLLKPALLAATTTEFQSRVVMVSSAAHGIHGINPSDNYNFGKGGYGPWVAYAQSKTANVYMANEIERPYGSPGLWKYLPAERIGAMLQDQNLLRSLKSSEQGAATTLWAAIGEEWEGKGGKHLSDCSEAERGADDGDGSSGTHVSHYHPDDEGRLWKDSLKMLALSGDE
ncbi:hypothetical protein V1525DRAFT_422741 [Lipomyces kononenkoae]|uniref:Uncharacterized protein n=1 Tax=Lipomyces kononenkoae TaxID=34357 RepID=A0ACC3SRA3_LIPKO